MPNKLFYLQLFGEEGGEMAVDSGFATGEAENPVGDGVATGSEGEQIASAEVTDQPSETWEDLIKGRYKKEYNASVKDAVNKRFKNQRNLQSQIDSIDPMIRALAQKYGIAANNDGSIPIEALTKSVMDDNSMYEQEAFKRGMSVDDLKEIKRLEQENLQLRRANQITEEQREWNEIEEQGNLTRELYPDFDLETEMQNPQFGRILATMRQSGFPNAVRTAYEAVHRDEIMGGAMRYAVSQTEQKISNSIQSGMRRPTENGTNSQSSASVGGFDPSKLTKAQLDDFKRRAERGERIVF